MSAETSGSSGPPLAAGTAPSAPMRGGRSPGSGRASEAEMRRDLLLFAAQQGDRWAFERLLTPRLPQLYGLALLATGGREAAADAVEATACAAFRAIRDYRPELSFAAWIGRLLREGVKAQGRDDQDPAWLESLAAPEREILWLRDREGYGYDEIAHLLGLSRAVVAARLAGARAALVRVLQEETA